MASLFSAGLGGLAASVQQGYVSNDGRYRLVGASALRSRGEGEFYGIFRLNGQLLDVSWRAATFFIPGSMNDSMAGNESSGTQTRQKSSLDPKVEEALKDCINKLWVGAVKLISFIPSRKGHSGEATFNYDVVFNNRRGTATVHNDVTTFNASGLDMFATMAETGNGDYAGPLTPSNGLGLTINKEIRSNLEGEVYKFSPYLNYTANDRERYSSGFTLLEKRMGKYAFTQAFELANSIGMITGWNVGLPSDFHGREPGYELGACMTNKLERR